LGKFYWRSFLLVRKVQLFDVCFTIRKKSTHQKAKGNVLQEVWPAKTVTVKLVEGSAVRWVSEEYLINFSYGYPRRNRLL
jgi:hypothetical protein